MLSTAHQRIKIHITPEVFVMTISLLVIIADILSVYFTSNKLLPANTIFACGMLIIGATFYRYGVRKPQRYSSQQSFSSTNHSNFDQSGTPVFAIGEDNKVTYTNQAFANLFEREKIKIINLDYQEIVDKVDNNAEQFYLKFSDKKKTSVKITSVIANNKQKYFFVTPEIATSTSSDDGYWNFFDRSPIAMVTVDQDMNIQRINKAYKNILGQAFKETEVKFLDVIEEGSHSIFKQHAASVIKSNNEAFNLKPIEVQLTNNNELTLLLYLNIIKGKFNNKDVLIARFIDITEQKNLELHFAHSQKMQAIGQLAGGIAHDFNNLLTAMLGFCDLLLVRHPAGDQSFADIMQIRQNANRAANLVRQLLAFSKKQVLHPEVIVITEVIAELSNLINRLIGEKIELKMHHGQSLFPVRVDQGQLEQVIINLAVNARDAMQDGGNLVIRTSNAIVEDPRSIVKNNFSPIENDRLDPGNYVLIEVTDTGCGIPKELISKIFEPFFSTKSASEGTGLGLSTVYGIIKQTGGHIYLTTKKNKGTKFSIYLKEHEDNGLLEETLKTDNKQNGELIFSDLTGNETILIVEDETPVRIFSTHALKNKGYKVLEADCGEQALEVIKEHGDKIDLIISDVVMPGMNGPEMIDEVKKSYPNIRVVFISGYAEDALIHSGKNAGEMEFLAKPFTLKQLASKVKEVITA